MIDLAKLREAIGERRANRGLRPVSNEIGIDHATLGRIMQGQVPTLETYARLCQWLGVSMDYFKLSPCCDSHSKNVNSD